MDHLKAIESELTSRLESARDFIWLCRDELQAVIDLRHTEDMVDTSDMEKALELLRAAQDVVGQYVEPYPEPFPKAGKDG